MEKILTPKTTDEELQNLGRRKKINFLEYSHNLFKRILDQSNLIKVVSMIVSANILATVLGIVGSLVQARFISPDDLGFIRKYSVISGYAIFLSLGLFSILQLEYPILIGRGKQEEARRTVAIVQSWCFLVSVIICGGLAVFTLSKLFQGHIREAAALFIQIISVWATLYLGFLTCTFRTGQEFEHLSKGQLISAFAGVLILPFFWLWPFPTLILRSVISQLFSSFYLNIFRPVKVGWLLPWKELLTLAKRGLRLYFGTYLRFSFWLTVEIWLMYRFAGDVGVGLFVFSKMIAEAIAQLPNAINQVYFPRLAQKFGQTGSIKICINFSLRPTLINLAISIFLIIFGWSFFPMIVGYAFPKYIEAIPLFRILLFQTLVASLSIPVYMVGILESYIAQFIAAVIGLVIFVGVSFFVYSQGYGNMAVVFGSLLGQASFAIICLLSTLRKASLEKKSSLHTEK